VAKHSQLQEQLEGLFSDLSTSAPPAPGVHEEMAPQPADDDVLRLFHEQADSPTPGPEPSAPGTAELGPALVPPDPNAGVAPPPEPATDTSIAAPAAAAPSVTQMGEEERERVAVVSAPQRRRVRMTATLKLFLAFVCIALVPLLIVMVFGRTPFVGLIALAVAAILAFQLIHLSGWAKAGIGSETGQMAAHELDEAALVPASQVHPASDKTAADEKPVELEQTIAQLNRQSSDLATGAEIARAAASSLDAAQVVRVTADAMHNRFQLHNVSIFLRDQSGETVTAAASSGAAAQSIMDRPQRWTIGDDSLVGAVCAAGQARFTGEMERTSNALLPKSRSELAVPLRTGGQLLGVLDLHSTEPNAFSAEDVHTYRGIADTVAISLLNAQRFAEKKRQLRSQELAAQLTDRIARETDLEGVVTVALKQLGTTFDLAQATICLGTEAELMAAGNGQKKGER